VTPILRVDFFVPDLFDEDALLARLQATPEFSLAARAPSTIHAVIQGTKVTFLGYPYPVLFPAARFEGVPVADPRDVACMKVSAIANRGTKRESQVAYLLHGRQEDPMPNMLVRLAWDDVKRFFRRRSLAWFNYMT